MGKIPDFYIPSAQDPNHYIKIGTVIDLDWVDEQTTSLYFVLGRHGSSSVADWWKSKVNADQNNYNNEPDNLNFAIKGAFTVNYQASQWETINCVFFDFFIAQGHTWDHNKLVDWWSRVQ